MYNKLTEEQKREKDIKRFESKIELIPFSTCWWWNAALRRKEGYGVFSIKSKLISAHRFSYQLHKGQIPESLIVRHICDNPLCVNPEHLILETYQDNMDDKVKRRRQNNKRPNPYPKGSKNSNSKLTEKEVLEIREKYIPYRYTCDKLASEYGVNKSSIHYIISKKGWKHI